MQERLQKLLAARGLGSRREIEGWISAGRLHVNGQVAVLGQKAGPRDQIKLDGRLLNLRGQDSEADTEVILYRKPEGEIVTRKDPEGRPSVFDNLRRPRRGRWISVGRLDFNTAGLLLFTNNGELANALMHPSKEIEREYQVRVLGEVDTAMIRRLLAGVQLDDGPASFSSLKEMPDLRRGDSANRWFRVVVKEGRNRVVRRLWESQGREVSRLIRVRFGPIELPRGLKTGKSVALSEEQLAALREACGV